ncbi:hypothetical protein BHE74_00039673 [Ensete ventricosum]|nr:hypothetical protein GW17_00019120 [Ensete ventricosum]RWW53797.1 hypothetical protein BHE74_00039673 [Ensete ventricosum]RZS12513.1 hypothetical protein BHM03_00043992 [Ensete ventricosum]
MQFPAILEKRTGYDSWPISPSWLFIFSSSSILGLHFFRSCLFLPILGGRAQSSYFNDLWVKRG